MILATCKYIETCNAIVLNECSDFQNGKNCVFWRCWRFLKQTKAREAMKR